MNTPQQKNTQIITFPGEDTAFVAPGWQALHALAFNISVQIKAGNHHFDRVVTLAKGGWPMSRSLADFLEMSEVQSLGIKFYKGIDQREAKPIVYQDLPIDISGESILLFDDVADTGESLRFATEYLENHGAASVTTATIYYKKRSSVTPDYFSAQVAEWIIFPYELVETLRILGTRWLAEGLSLEEVIARFIALNFEASQVEHYVSTLLLSDV